MSVINIHITSDGNFKPVGGGLNGKYHVQIVGSTISGTIKFQSRVTELYPGTQDQVPYSDIIDPKDGASYSFTTAGSFEIELNGHVNINISGSTNPDFYVLLKEIKTQKI